MMTKPNVDEVILGHTVAQVIDRDGADDMPRISAMKKSSSASNLSGPVVDSYKILSGATEAFKMTPKNASMLKKKVLMIKLTSCWMQDPQHVLSEVRPPHNGATTDHHWKVLRNTNLSFGTST